MKPYSFFLFLSLFFQFSRVLAQSGALDSTFGTQGVVFASHGTNAEGTAYMIDKGADGKIVVGGTAFTGIGEPLMLARFESDGSIDQGFGASGVVVMAKYKGQKLRVLPNGKVLVLLYRGMGLVRLNEDGSEDLSFATPSIPYDLYKEALSSDLYIQPDGKILVCGFWITNHLDQFCMVRYLPDGGLDTTFSQDGFLENPISGYSSGIGFQSDGKILLTGNEGHGKLTTFRFHENGSPDSSFGINGISKWPVAVGDDKIIGRAFHILSDGRLRVVADVLDDPNSQMAILGLQANGQPDSTFGENGVQVNTVMAKVYRIQIQSDGKMVIGGFTKGTNKQATFARFHPDGNIDSSFSPELWGVTNEQPMDFILQNDKIVASIPVGAGPSFYALRLLTNGDADNDFGQFGRAYAYAKAGDDHAKDIAAQSDGKIIAIGDSYSENNGNIKAMMVRYLPSGVPDPSFGTGGKAIYSLLPPNNCRGYAVTVQPDGKIIALMGHYYLDIVLKVVRLNANGSIDPSFGTNGIVALPGEYKKATDIQLQPDGKILVAATHENESYTAIRLLANGTFDTSFGTGGVTNINMGTSTEVGICAGMVIQADGKIVLGGMVGWTDAGVARLKPDGKLDLTFSGDGKLRKVFGTGFAFVRAFTLQADGKFLIVGSTKSPDDETQCTIMRLQTNGAIDGGFGEAGKAIITTIAGYHSFQSVLVQPDQKILALGYNSNTTTGEAIMARFMPTGSLDSSFNDTGILTKDFGWHYANLEAMALQADGKIIVAGGIRREKDIDFGILRFISGLTVATGEQITVQASNFAYPNPCTDLLSVDISAINDPVKDLQIFDLVGKQVQQVSNVSSNTISIHLQQLPAGTYVLVIRTETGVYTQKIMKN